MSFGLMPDLPREGGSDAYSTLSPESTGVVDPVFFAPEARWSPSKPRLCDALPPPVY